MFSDYYGEQSRTVGRAAFIAGQNVFRTGNSKVGKPAHDEACRKKTRQSPNF
jgi:arylsulfatase A-like enzyme